MAEKETNFKQIQSVAKALLMTEPALTEFSPAIVQHPFTRSGLCMVKKGGIQQIIDITKSKENLRLWQKEISETIDRTDLSFIYTILNPSYSLTFLKYAEPYLSLKDFSEILGDAWIMSENPSRNAHMSTSRLIRMFRKADLEALMDKNELGQYRALDDIVNVYRGVTARGAESVYALSWTLNYDTAEWFANRFGKDGKVYEAQIDKENILALFNRRNESEVIVDPSGLINIEETQTPNNGMNLL